MGTYNNNNNRVVLKAKTYSVEIRPVVVRGVQRHAGFKEVVIATAKAAALESVIAALRERYNLPTSVQVFGTATEVFATPGSIGAKSMSDEDDDEDGPFSSYELAAACNAPCEDLRHSNIRR